MAKPAPKLKEKNEAEVSSLARTLATGLAGHPAVVATPAVTPTQLDNGAQALDDSVQALADYDGGRKFVADAVQSARTALEALIVKSTDDSAVQTNYDRTKLETIMVPLQSEGNAAPDTSPLQNFHVSHGDHEGYVDGGCNRRKGTKIYRGRCGTAATGPWTIVYEGSASSFTIQNQPLGVLCYFQMAAFVGGVWTEWSDIAQLRIV